MGEPLQSVDPREAAQIAYWNDRTAASWTTFQNRLDAVFEPITKLAIQATAPSPGERVVDIGCGCGVTVLELAQQVGPQGHVLGIDVSEPMSARARERIAAAHLTNAEIVVADAATYALPPPARDLLFSRFGVMFFAEPVAALINLRRAMRKGARLGWVVWRTLDENPWFATPLQAALPLLPPTSAADPMAPGPFAFADADRVRQVLQAAGWRDAKLVRHDLPLRLSSPDDLAGAAELTTWVGPLARRLTGPKADDPELRAVVKRAVENALRAHAGTDGIVLTASIWLVSAEA